MNFNSSNPPDGIVPPLPFVAGVARSSDTFAFSDGSTIRSVTILNSDGPVDIAVYVGAGVGGTPYKTVRAGIDTTFPLTCTEFTLAYVGTPTSAGSVAVHFTTTLLSALTSQSQPGAPATRSYFRYSWVSRHWSAGLAGDEAPADLTLPNTGIALVAGQSVYITDIAITGLDLARMRWALVLTVDGVGPGSTTGIYARGNLRQTFSDPFPLTPSSAGTLGFNLYAEEGYIPVVNPRGWVSGYVQ